MRLILFLALAATVFRAAAPVDCLAQVFDDDYLTQDQMVVKGAIGLFSDRHFRGQNLYNGTSIQPRAEFGVGTGMGLLYVSGFAHFSGDNNTDGNVRKDFTEFDWEVGHRFIIEDIQLDLGHRWYTYNRTTPRLVDSEEIFLEITSAVIAHPHFSMGYDYDEHKGWYYEIGLEQPILIGARNDRDAIIPWVTMGLSSDLDDGAHPIYDDNGIAFMDVGLRAELELIENLNVEPEMHYSSEVDDATTSDFVFGINLTGSLGETRN